ncbi:hypothetical protein ACQVP2_22460 [Methylobacterium aquaticum]|uniref:hypothetical protein n=1 Tax=Methylobacterium aquaticum TaxID=270351 RepID=UPI003D17D3F2
MKRPAPLKPGQVDPLSDVFAAEYAAGASFGRIAARYGIDHNRVARTLRRRPGFVQRTVSESCLIPHRAAMDRIAARAREELDRLRPAPTFTPVVAAAGTGAAIRALRDRARHAGPVASLAGMPRLSGAVWADVARIAAAHAAGLTLDDIHEVFAVPPAEAVRAIAAHAGR